MTRHLISVSSIYKVIASTLAISVNQITEELSYQSIAQWDSMGHINIMLALEKEFDLKIDQDQVLELTTVKQIVIFVLPRQTKNSARHCDDKVEIVLHRGLNNVFFDESHITFIDAVNSKLFYRGYDINDLVSHASYEEVAYLLIYGELPNQKLLNVFIDKIRLFRNISEDMATLIKILASQQSATSVLRTLSSVLSEALAPLSLEDQGIAYIAKMPIILGMYFSFKNNVTFSLPPNDLSQAAYLLYMLLGKIPDKKILRIFEQNMILQAEHDSNASTFSARIAASTEAELGNSITAAIATFSGGLHGGALLGVVQMLDEIQDEGNVKHYIQDRLQKKLPIFGFGHRVYRSEDPRAEFLKINAKILSEICGNNRFLKILEAIKIEMIPYMQHGINVNVDFYASISYLLIGLKNDMLVPVFMLSRSVGWVAHFLEQKNNNILIRPRLYYVGKKTKLYEKGSDRVNENAI